MGLVGFKMEKEEIKEVIEKTRKDLEKERDKIKDISKLVKKKIDREHPVDYREFSDTELEDEMGRRIIRLNENLNIIHRINQRTSNKLMKILLVIPYLIHFVFTKPLVIMKDYLAINHLLLIRMQKMDQKLTDLQTRLLDVEGNQELITSKLKSKS
jgi:hypothetical protein